MSRGLYTALSLGLAAVIFVLGLVVVAVQEPPPSTEDVLETMQEYNEMLDEHKRLIEEQNRILELLILQKQGKLKGA